MRRTTVALLTLLAAAVGLWLYANFERVPAKTDVGYHGEAARNDFLAATRLLQRLGLEVQPLHDLSSLRTTSPRDTLLLSAGRGVLTPIDVQALVSWVDAGGHLIVPVESASFKNPLWNEQASRKVPPDKLLDALGVKREWAKDSGKTFETPSKPVTLVLPEAKQGLHVSMQPGGYLLSAPRDPGALTAGDGPAGTALLHFGHGDGAVTVLASLDFATNRNIGNQDNAELLWQVMHLDAPPGTVWLARRIEVIPLSQWLLQHALAAFLAALVLLLAWLWRTLPRFGPLQGAAPTPRRSLLEHLQACGRFYWTNQRGRLLDMLRQSCLRRMARARPALAHAVAEERAAALASAAGVSAADVEFALSGTAQDRFAFIHAVQVLQRIEDNIAHIVNREEQT